MKVILYTNYVQNRNMYHHYHRQYNVCTVEIIFVKVNIRDPHFNYNKKYSNKYS